MATHKSALKRHRQSLGRKQRNRARRSEMKTTVKLFLKALEQKEQEPIKKALNQAASVIAKTASKGVIHKNTASRRISRLTKRANAAIQANG